MHEEKNVSSILSRWWYPLKPFDEALSSIYMRGKTFQTLSIFDALFKFNMSMCFITNSYQIELALNVHKYACLNDNFKKLEMLIFIKFEVL